MRYEAGTLDYGLHYARDPDIAHFIGYCDSDIADDIDISKSLSRTMFFKSKCIVSWQ
jgi:hypothetical protein